MKKKRKRVFKILQNMKIFTGGTIFGFQIVLRYFEFLLLHLKLDRTLDLILTVCQVKGIHFVINSLFILSDWLGYVSFGHIACLNIWNRNFSPEVLKAFSLCKNKGNVYNLNMTSGTLHGDVSRTTYNESGYQRIMLS